MGKGRLTRLLGGALGPPVLVATLLAGSVAAAPGDLDLSWSGDGVQTLSSTQGARYANASILQPDGKLVVAGAGTFNETSSAKTGTYVARYTTAGDLDTTFGTGGVAKLNAVEGFEAVRDVTLDSSGRVIVVGYGESVYPDISDVYAMRFTATGTPDTTFSGDGLTIIDRTNHDRVGGVAMSGTRIILGAMFDLGGNWANQWTAVALNNTGALDATFSSDGLSEIPTAQVGYYDDIRDVVIQPDGKLLLGGYHYRDFAVARMSAAGVLDATWDGDGVARTLVETGGSAYKLLLQSDKKVVLAGHVVPTGRTDDDFAAVRWNTNGTLDTSFSGDGKTVLDFGPKKADRALTAGLAADDKIVLAGHSSPVGMDMAIARLNWDGTPDMSFSGDGRNITSSNPANNEQVESLVIGANDRIVTAGWNLTGWVMLGYSGSGVPSFSVTDATVTEPDAGTVNATFTVKLSAASTSPITLRYATAAGKATTPGDFTTKSGVLTFAPGQTSQTVTVAVVGDTAVEPAEQFKLNLSRPTNAAISDGVGVCTIVNDD
jgi:uncharacterized delta-60 repeat protein